MGNTILNHIRYVELITCLSKTIMLQGSYRHVISSTFLMYFNIVFPINMAHTKCPIQISVSYILEYGTSPYFLRLSSQTPGPAFNKNRNQDRQNQLHFTTEKLYLYQQVCLLMVFVRMFVSCLQLCCNSLNFQSQLYFYTGSGCFYFSTRLRYPGVYGAHGW